MVATAEVHFWIERCSIPIRLFYPNPPPKNQGLIKTLFPRNGLIETLFLQNGLNKTVWGHYVACIYEVLGFLNMFFKTEKKMADPKIFGGFL